MAYFISPKLFFETAELNTHYLGWLLLGDFYYDSKLVFKNNVLGTKTITKSQTIGAYSGTIKNSLSLHYKKNIYTNEAIGINNARVVNGMLLVSTEDGYSVEQNSLKIESNDANGESSVSIGDVYVEISKLISDTGFKILGYSETDDHYYISSKNAALVLVDYGTVKPDFKQLITDQTNWYTSNSNNYLENFKNFNVLYGYKTEDINSKINKNNFYNLVVGNIKVKFNNLEVN